jgi:hypothetical protein
MIDENFEPHILLFVLCIIQHCLLGLNRPFFSFLSSYLDISKYLKS